jgi:hypothetical protein
MLSHCYSRENFFLIPLDFIQHYNQLLNQALRLLELWWIWVIEKNNNMTRYFLSVGDIIIWWILNVPQMTYLCFATNMRLVECKQVCGCKLRMDMSIQCCDVIRLHSVCRLYAFLCIQVLNCDPIKCKLNFTKWSATCWLDVQLIFFVQILLRWKSAAAGFFWVM